VPVFFYVGRQPWLEKIDIHGPLLHILRHKLQKVVPFLRQKYLKLFSFCTMYTSYQAVSWFFVVGRIFAKALESSNLSTFMKRTT